MSKSQRTKGAQFERECVTRMNEHGADAERNLSQSRDGGYDIDSLWGAFECKKRARLPSYLCPGENVRGVIFAQDRGERLVLLRAEDAYRLLAEERKAKEATCLSGVITHGVSTGSTGPESSS